VANRAGGARSAARRGGGELWGGHPAAFESEVQGWFFARPATLDVIGKLMVRKLTADWFFGPVPRDPQNFAPGRGQGFLTVGETMGAGAIALQEEPATPARLVRPEAGPGGAEQLHDVLSHGPLRAIVRTRIWNWQGARGSYAATILHLVIAGQRYCESRMRFDQYPPGCAAVRIAAGFQQLPTETHFATGDGWLAASGRTSADSATNIGLALLSPGGWSGEPSLTDLPAPDHVVSVGAVGEAPLRLYHVAAWDRDGGLGSAWDWPQSVAALAASLRHPVGVIVER